MFDICIEFLVEQMYNYLEYLQVNEMLPSNYPLQEYVGLIPVKNLNRNSRFQHLNINIIHFIDYFRLTIVNKFR